MEEAKTMKTPMSSSIKLDMDEKGKPVNSTMYRGMIGSLLYLTASRPDIMVVQLHLQVSRFRVCGCSSSLLSFSVWTLFSSFASLMAPRRETGTSRAQGKRPVEPSQPEQTEAHRKARFDTTLFSSNEDYQRYKQKFAQRKVVIGRSVNFSQLQHFGFEGCWTDGMAARSDDL
ncbi:hypothetical protein CK203_021152 [Vitis vinifera]|uniref:Retrovirus-related Pol polyprotein from transposon RE1 n=1 Tax=Vitis vinifera TaxID=29760 RepID=A0A438JWP2_VITVI|nr:hypothetical protein CK203_021152 [Vitis vinifera]